LKRVVIPAQSWSSIRNLCNPNVMVFFTLWRDGVTQLPTVNCQPATSQPASRCGLNLKECTLVSDTPTTARNNCSDLVSYVRKCIFMIISCNLHISFNFDYGAHHRPSEAIHLDDVTMSSLGWAVVIKAA
jgi:hypothetical protein